MYIHAHTQRHAQLLHCIRAGTVFKEKKIILNILIFGQFLFKSICFVSLPSVPTVFNKGFKGDNT